MPVRLSRVPNDFAAKVGQARDEFDQVFDADFKRAAEVDRFTLVVLFRCQDDSFRGVFDIQKLARRTAVAPHDNFTFPRAFRVHTLF